MYKKYISVFSFIILLMLIYSNVFAHSGRTDTLGGHKDNKNVIYLILNFYSKCSV